MNDVLPQIALPVPTINVTELVQEMTKPNQILLDVRGQNEREIVMLKDSLHIPLNELTIRFHELPKDKKIFVYCHLGGRSHRAVQFLKSKGFDAVNVAGGINQYAMDIDTSLPTY